MASSQYVLNVNVWRLALVKETWWRSTLKQLKVHLVSHGTQAQVSCVCLTHSPRQPALSCALLVFILLSSLFPSAKALVTWSQPFQLLVLNTNYWLMIMPFIYKFWCITFRRYRYKQCMRTVCINWCFNFWSWQHSLNFIPSTAYLKEPEKEFSLFLQLRSQTLKHSMGKLYILASL